MSNLAPCPFCGSKNVYGCYEVVGYSADQSYCIKCPKCGAVTTFNDDAAETVHDVDVLYCRRA